MSLNKYEWLTRTITSHEHEVIRTDFLEYRFSRMRWFVTKFEKNAQRYYHRTESVVIDKI